MFTYTTQVRIQPSILKAELGPLKEAYDKLDPTGERRKSKKVDGDVRGTMARSAFSRWNNLNHFYFRLIGAEEPRVPVLKTFEDGSVLINVTAEAKGNSTRVYFHPSITSLSKEIRKAIKPIDDNKVFVYTDIKAAEFALRAVQADDQDALATYSQGGDIYMHFKNLFPEGTPRKTIKTILIANMYGKSAYSTGKDLGVSEFQAQRILDSVARAMPKFTQLKYRIADYARTHNGYFVPKGNELVKVADINPKKGFDPNMAWSAYTQSALGFRMQDFTNKYLEHQKGEQATFLSIFDSVIAEVSPDRVDAFSAYFKKLWAPLLPDGFHVGKTMYEAMYGDE